MPDLQAQYAIEREWIRRFRKGDEDAFKQMFFAFYPKLLIFVERFVLSRDSADEIVKDLFVDLWQRRERLSIWRSLRAYLYAAAHNRALNFLRMSKARKRHLTVHVIEDEDWALIPSPTDDPLEELERKELEAEVQKAIAIEPERIKEWEFGIDVEFLKMFSLEFTHYRQNAMNSIVPSTTSPSTGLYRFSYPVNIGSIKSWGFESQLQVSPIRSADYDLTLSFIWNYQTNEVENLGETDEITNGTEVIRPGLPKHEFYTYTAVSPKFDATTQKYIGVNLSTDRVDLGNPVPDHSGSVSVNFRFLKNFTLYAMGEWALNNKIYANSINRLINYNTYLPQRDLALKLGLIGSSSLLPRDAGITPLTPGTPEYVAAAWQYIQYDRGANGNFVQDASFFVFREFSLGYDLTALLNEYLPNSYVTGINVGLSVRNVYRWSKYDLGFEASSTGGRSDFLGEDYNTLPQPRNIRFWARFGF